MAAIVVTLSGIAAVAVHAAYPLLLGLVLAIGYYFWRQHGAPLMVITLEETATANRSHWIAVISGLFLSLLS